MTDVVSLAQHRAAKQAGEVRLTCDCGSQAFYGRVRSGRTAVLCLRCGSDLTGDLLRP